MWKFKLRKTENGSKPLFLALYVAVGIRESRLLLNRKLKVDYE
jgi:hypothetical protein